MQSQWLPICQISVWFFCGSVLEPTRGLWDSQELKAKNKQIEPGEASRDIFRHRSKQFWANLLTVASFPFFSAVSWWTSVWAGSPLLQARFCVTCCLWFLISRPWYEGISCTPTHLLIPGIWSSFWQHSWECCHRQILKLQGCGITDEMCVVLIWETSGLRLSLCHSNVMCCACAVATSWKLSGTPYVDSSQEHSVSSVLGIRSFVDIWSQIKTVALAEVQHSLTHIFVLLALNSYLVFSIIMLQWLPCGKFPTRIGTSAFRFTLLHMGGNEHHFREHLGTLLDGCSPSRYLLWCKACISLITFPSISVSTLECIFQLQYQWFIQPKEAVQLQLGYCDG